MRPNLRFVLVLLMAWLAEVMLAPYFAVAGVTPDLILIVVASQAFIEGPGAGAVAGFTGGLLQDLLVAQGIGLNLMAKTIIGYLSGMVERTVFGSSNLLPTIAMFAVSFVSQMIYITAAFLVGQPIELGVAVLSTVLPSALYTAAVTFFIFSRVCGLLSEERQETVFR